MRRLTLAALAGLALGAVIAQHPGAVAEVRRSTPDQAFSSGAMRAESVLREIASILRTMDARVARVEASLQRIEKSQRESKPHVP